MSLSRVAAAADPWTAWWNSFGKWLEGWWNVETLGPDLLVGLATGGVVGLIVMRAERRISARTREREVADAQASVVERARNALLFEIRFPGDNVKSLHPDQSLLQRIVEDVAAIPSGTPAVHVPGFRWVSRLAGAVAELEDFADALDVRVADHDRNSGGAGILATWTNLNISDYAERPADDLEGWRWIWRDSPVPDPVFKTRVEEDRELWAMIVQYGKQRRLLRAYREAFLETMTYLRDEEVKAVSSVRNARGWRFKKKRVARAAENRIRASKVWADLQALEIVTQVDPNAV